MAASQRKPQRHLGQPGAGATGRAHVVTGLRTPPKCRSASGRRQDRGGGVLAPRMGLEWGHELHVEHAQHRVSVLRVEGQKAAGHHGEDVNIGRHDAGMAHPQRDHVASGNTELGQKPPVTLGLGAETDLCRDGFRRLVRFMNNEQIVGACGGSGAGPPHGFPTSRSSLSAGPRYPSVPSKRTCKQECKGPSTDRVAPAPGRLAGRAVLKRGARAQVQLLAPRPHGPYPPWRSGVPRAAGA